MGSLIVALVLVLIVGSALVVGVCLASPRDPDAETRAERQTRRMSWDR